MITLRHDNLQILTFRILLVAVKFVEAVGLDIFTPNGFSPSRCTPISVNDNILRAAWSETEFDDEQHAVQIFWGKGGLSGVNLCSPIDSAKCGGFSYLDDPMRNGMCPLNGSMILELPDGLHVVHLLVVSKDSGYPVGDHETILLQVCELVVLDFDVLLHT